MTPFAENDEIQTTVQIPPLAYVSAS